MSDMERPSEYQPGDRVLYRATFGKPGTVVACSPASQGEQWLWVMWDEYPEGHEPTTHGSWTCTLKERPNPHPFGIVDDGFGNEWVRCKDDCTLEVVRPGRVQCWECDQ